MISLQLLIRIGSFATVLHCWDIDGLNDHAGGLRARLLFGSR